MFKEISKINFSEFENIIKNPSQFLQEYNLSLSNNEIYFIFSLILLFIVGVFFELFKPKKEILDSDLPDIDYKSKNTPTMNSSINEAMAMMCMLDQILIDRGQCFNVQRDFKD